MKDKQKKNLKIKKIKKGVMGTTACSQVTPMMWSFLLASTRRTMQKKSVGQQRKDGDEMGGTGGRRFSFLYFFLIFAFFSTKKQNYLCATYPGAPPYHADQNR